GGELPAREDDERCCEERQQRRASQRGMAMGIRLLLQFGRHPVPRGVAAWGCTAPAIRLEADVQKFRIRSFQIYRVCRRLFGVPRGIFIPSAARLDSGSILTRVTT